MEIWKRGLERFVKDNSKYLFLGSFPSKKSLEAGFYFMNKQNKFYKVLQHVFNDYSDISTLEKKKEFLIRHNVALWDVYAEVYQKENSSKDTDIKENKVNHCIESLVKEKELKVFVLGKTAQKQFEKEFPGIDFIPVPSTSSANGHYTIEKIADIISENID